MPEIPPNPFYKRGARGDFRGQLSIPFLLPEIQESIYGEEGKARPELSPKISYGL
jgi:hypothetical protein